MIKFVKKLSATILIVCITYSCTKIDTTSIGSGLIPPVDGVNTLRTDTFTLTTENGIFNDTSLFAKGEDYVIGNLPFNSNFGSTRASLFVQFGPSFQFNWAAPKDSIAQMSNQGFDSAFVSLGLSDAAIAPNMYGDTMMPITYNVYLIPPTVTNFKPDSAYRIAVNPNINYTSLLGTITIAPKDIDNQRSYKLKNVTDSVRNMLRIPLNTAAGIAYAKNMLTRDTTNDFKNATNYRAAFKGFYIEAVGGGAIARFNFSTSNNTRLEMWYRYRKGGVVDTTNAFFFYNANVNLPYLSSACNYINRNTTGSAMLAATSPGVDNIVYLESTPGSFARIKLPTIKSLGSKLVHQAELVITEVATTYDPSYFAPNRLYLDVFDTASANSFKTVPLDFYILNGGGADLNYFGGLKKVVTNTIGANVNEYKFNVTKYIQSMLTRNSTNYDMRLYSPYSVRFYTQRTGGYFRPDDTFFNYPFINLPTLGRVVVGGGNHPTAKMKLIITYSNI